MQEFWIRLVSLFIVVSSLWGYNMTIDKREQENKNTQHIAAETESTDSQGAYKDGAYLAMAEDIIPSIISAQSADVDTVSGATFSSTAIKNATKQALDKAVK